MLLLCSAGGCVQWAQGSGTPGRFKMQIGHLCSTAQTTVTPHLSLDRVLPECAPNHVGCPKAALWWRSPMIHTDKQKDFAGQQGTMNFMIWEGGKTIYLLLQKSLISNWRRWHAHKNKYREVRTQRMATQFYQRQVEKRTISIMRWDAQGLFFFMRKLWFLLPIEHGKYMEWW